MSLSHAHVGDLVFVEGRRVGDSRRVGEILEILGVPDHPRYRVRWDDGHEVIFYPGGGAEIRPAPERQRTEGRGHARHAAPHAR
ncbi:MAG TPA: DUF1918 domain-containing protein [Gaiellaceae bacterium]|nr:DUF1918 domain-containing protein [Gaiellaceae bacterium]